MPDWRVQALRLTTFVENTIGRQLPEQWWLNVVGDAPDHVRAEPKLFQFYCDVQYALGLLALQIQPSRIDWLYVASNFLEPEELLGSLDEAVKSFSEIIKRWFALDTCPDSARVALGTVLEIPVKSRVEAYHLLAGYLPKVEIDDYASDFLFQINRPREMIIDDQVIMVNRLTKWSAAATLQQQVVIEGLGLIDQRTASMDIAARLELDINTARQVNLSFNPKMQEHIFEHLVSLGREIAAKGDIS